MKTHVAYKLMALALICCESALAAPGDLDAGFGTGGMASYNLPQGDRIFHGVVAQADGKIIVAGEVGEDFAMVRYTSSGATDSAFGNRGKVLTDVGGIDSARAVALQADGKIVLVGYSGVYDGGFFPINHIVLARYHTNGMLDGSFGQQGIVHTYLNLGGKIWSPEERAEALVIQVDGKIIVAGMAENNDTDEYFEILVRYDANGTLDTSFGSGGWTLAPNGATYDSRSWKAVALQADGKILVGGNDYQFKLARYHASGAIDTSFGNQGIVTHFLGNNYDTHRALALQSDGKIVCAGESDFHGSVIRFTTTGALDTSFGTNGATMVNFNGFVDQFNAIAIQPSDNKIVAVGEGSLGNFEVVRFNANGTVDTRFGSSGRRSIDFGTNESALAVALDNSGRIVAAGMQSAGSHTEGAIAAAARLTASGALDTTFSSDGKVLATFSDDRAFALAFYENNILLAGEAGFLGAVLPVLTNGVVNEYVNEFTTRFGKKSASVRSVVPLGTFTSYFAVGGFATDNHSRSSFAVHDTDIDDARLIASASGDALAYAMVRQTDGKYLLGGTMWNGTDFDFAVARCREDLSLDTTFGTGGIVRTGMGPADDQINALVLQPDGKIIAAGSAWNGNNFDFALVRYHANGSLDLSFDTDGKVITAFSSDDEEAYAVALQPDGKIVAGGYQVVGSNFDFALARYQGNGALDNSFSSDGRVTQTMGGTDIARGLAIYPSGKIVVGGHGASQFAAAVFNPDGGLDNTFSGDGRVTVAFPNGSSAAHALSLDAAGKIILAGYAFNGLDDDFAVVQLEGAGPPVLNVQAATYTPAEGAGSLAITVTLFPASAQNVAVNYSTLTGTASAGTDYTAQHGTLTFLPGETNRVVTVPIAQDSYTEADEAFGFAINTPINAALGVRSTADVFIIDDEPKPTVSFGGGMVTNVAENQIGFSLWVQLSSASAEYVTVNYFTRDGTATATNDYTALSGTFGFDPGQTLKFVSININNDALDELNETFYLVLSNAVGARISTTNLLLTITDDDTPSLQLSSGTYSASENGGTVSVTVNAIPVPAQTISVQFGTTNRSATAPSDYTGTNGTLTFSAGQASRSFSIALINDGVDETNEAFGIYLTNPTGATLGLSTGMVTIVDSSSPPTVQFSAAQYTVAETTFNATINVLLSGPSAQSVSVSYATSDGSATTNDYTPRSGTLVFTAGQTNRSFTIPVSMSSMQESNETVNLRLSNPTNATFGAPTNALLTITDSSLPPLVQLVTPLSVSESNGAATMQLRLTQRTFPFSPQPSGIPVSVDYDTTGLSATPEIDFTPTAGTVVFQPGETNKTVTIPIAIDTTYETNETIEFVLLRVQQANFGSRTNVTFEILDDDLPPLVRYSSNTFVAPESAGLATVLVTLSEPSGLPASVDFWTTNGSALAGADYTTTNGTLLFAPGETAASFQVPLNADALDEASETVLLRLRLSTNATLATPTNATLTVQDSTPAPTVTFATNRVAATEKDGNIATVEVRLSAPSALTVSVRALATNFPTASALAGIDYVATNTLLVFAAGETNKIFSISILNDALVETNEVFALLFSDPKNASASGSATVTINDDDRPTVLLATNSITVGEGDGVIPVTVQLSTPSGLAVSVAVGLNSGTASAGSDFARTNALIVFASGETNRTLLLRLVDDALDEPVETATLTLFRLTNAIAGSPSNGTVYIQDNDPPRIGFRTNTFTLPENGGAIGIETVLSSAHDVTIYVDYATADGSASAGSDYIAATGTLVFAPGQTNKSFAVTLLNDRDVETNETVQLRLFDLVTGTPDAWTNAVLIVGDDDFARLSMAREGSNVVVSWTNTAVGFALQSTTGLGGTNQWVDEGVPLVSTNNQTRATVPLSNAVRFFRLRK